MTSQAKCPSCRSGLEPDDRFCPSCGREVARSAAAPADDHPAGGGPCPACGRAAPPGSSACPSCGTRLGAASPGGTAAPTSPRVDSPVSAAHSWKLTLAVAAALVAALVVFVSSRGTDPPPHTHDDPHDAGMMERIRTLQTRIDAQPDDADALLELANLLYDVQFFERAAALYERHLTLRPGNADARVDLGTSYFQLSFHDSAAAGGFVARAESCFVDAIRGAPKHQLAHFNLGILHLHRGEMEEAEKWLRMSIDLDPGSEAARRANQLLTQHLKTSPTS